jgi:hypothetical protein
MDLTTVKLQNEQYAVPALKKVDVEEAKIFLRAKAAHGDLEATELLKLLMEMFA